MCGPQENHGKKDVKFKVVAKKWLWWKINGNSDISGIES